MTIAPFLRWPGVVAVLLFVIPLSSQALSVYDVIQLSQKNYSDQNIVALIQDTGSAFKLEAKDVVRLKELGLSEPVIRTMLKAIPEDMDGETAANSPAVSPSVE